MPVDDYGDRFSLAEDELGGNAQRFSARIRSITIQEGDPIQLPTPGLTLIVGGNNAGKSTLLRQMHARLTAGWSKQLRTDPALLRDQDLVVSGSLADAYAWLAANSHASKDGFQRNSVNVAPAGLNLVWSQSLRSGQLEALGQAITLAPNARSRFGAVLPAERRPDVALPPATALHYLEDDPDLMSELDEYTREIFGTGLTLDPLSGKLMIRFGKVDIDAPPVDAVTLAYKEAITRLTTLEHQGDGIGSALGLLIPLVAGRNPIAFIDEPEAFLHPPQAFKLGRTVAAIARRHGSQIVVATHDRNFVAGALSATDVQLAVVRLDRAGESTRGHVVEPMRLRDVWSSAILRHSNVLDGLFHRAVVVAENERDCVFYSAALEAVEDLPAGFLPSDVLFVAAHGKAGIPEVARILSAAHVPVVAVADLDVVREVDGLRKIVEAVGGQWSEEIENSIRPATAEFRVARKTLTRGQILAAIETVLRDDSGAPYDSKSRKDVASALAVESPWVALKKHGMSAFRSDRPAADRLVSALSTEGVVVVEAGELESFAPSLGVAKGRSWLPSALDAGAHRAPLAQSFVQGLVAAILNRESRLQVR